MFTHLHVHSDHSLFDGYQTIDEILNRVKELGQEAVAITEHGTMASIIEFHKKTLEQDIKPIIGCEFYFCEDKFIKDRAFTHHLILLAKNKTGYMNLKRLNKTAFNKDDGHFYFKPRIDSKELAEYSDGLICLSACLASIINTEDGEKWVQYFKNIFGDDFYLEVQPHPIDEQKEYNFKLLSYCARYKVKAVVTTDAHYSKKEDAIWHKKWIGLQKGEYYTTDTNYLWSEDELLNSNFLPQNITRELIRNTQEITNKIEIYDLAPVGNHFPTYPTNNACEKIKEICRSVWKDKVPQGHYKEYGDRFLYELSMLEKCGYTNYLLLTWDFLNWCKEKKILTGVGRGCSIKGTKVLLKNGFEKNIEDVVVGDVVVGHSGNFRKVIDTMKYDIDEPLCKITVGGNEPMTFTCDHKILAHKRVLCKSYKGTPKERKWEKVEGEPSWIEMKDLSPNDIVYYPIVKEQKGIKVIDMTKYVPVNYYDDKYIYYGYSKEKKFLRFITVDEDFCRLVGYVVGNGYANEGTSTKYSYRFGVSFPFKHLDYAEDFERIMKNKFGVTVYWNWNKRYTCVDIVASLKPLSYLFASLCGKHAINKHIPIDVVGMNKENVCSVICGLMRTDGHIGRYKNRLECKYSTTSKVLYNQVKMLFTFIGLHCNNFRARASRSNWNDELVVKTNTQGANIVAEIKKNKFDNVTIDYDKCYDFQYVRKVEFLPKTKTTVYDITTEEDHSYVANGSIVHNSVGGSVVAWLLGIHHVDPIKYNLLFERFCNPERVSAPDIDNDLQTSRRGEAIGYLIDKYGNVMKIRTYSYLGNKSAIKRAGQVLGIEPTIVNDITKQIEEIDDVINVRAKVNKEKLIDTAKHFYGRMGAFGSHASAVLITPDDTINYVPIEYQSVSDESLNGERIWTQVASGDFHDLENFGLMKLDVLGLNTLDVIDNTLKQIKDKVDIYNLDTNDEKVFKLYQKGDLLGCFQMDSSGMRKLAKDMKVSCFENIIALVALFRPGPLGSGLVDSYVNGKNGGRIIYLCKEIEEVLSPTYNVIVYQEQVMLLAQKLAGYTMGQADMLRKIIGRKEEDKIEKATQDFKAAVIKKGFSKEIAEYIGNQIKAAGRYIFNKSHATAYGYLSYITAYLKVYYPKEFMCALINSKKDQKDVVPYMEECKRLDIKILPPDLRKGNLKWQVEKEGIRVGLTYIRNVGSQVDTIHYKDYQDVVEHNNKKITEGLIKAGAMDFLNIPRGKMLMQLVSMQDFLKRKNTCKQKVDENSLALENAKLKNDAKEIRKYERQLASWKEKLEKCTLEETTDWQEVSNCQLENEVLKFTFSEIPRVKDATIKQIKLHKDKKGKEMAFVVFITNYREYNCTVFARQWKAWKDNFSIGAKCKIACSNSQNPILDDFVLM